MRDLKADLDKFNSLMFREHAALLAIDILPEAIERAIAAEELVANLQNSIQKMIDQDVEWHCEFGDLREENDIQRSSIQQLSAQVVKMQVVVDTAKELSRRMYFDTGFTQHQIDESGTLLRRSLSALEKEDKHEL